MDFACCRCLNFETRKEGFFVKTAENKKILADNILYYMNLRGVSKQQVCAALDLKYSTFVEWIKGRAYPRIGTVEKLANYFGCEKSDLIEEKTEEHRQMQKKNDTLTDIVLRLRSDDVFLEAVDSLYKMDSEKLKSLLALLK